MKRLIVAAGILLFSSMVSATVYAGTLNQYEAEVVEAAQKIYEYEGVQYKVDQSYIDQLVAYLSSDGVDLTAEQRDEVLQSAYGSIETGVSEGYLKPTTQSQPEATPTPATQVTDTTDNTTDSEEASGSDDGSSEGQEQSGETSDTTSAENASNDASEVTGNVSEASEEKELVSAEELIKNVLKADQTVTPTPIPQVSQESSIFDSLNDKDQGVSSIIKDTGFNFMNTIIVITGIGVLMLVAIYVTFRTRLFAHEDE